MKDFFQLVTDSGGIPNFFWEITPQCNQRCPMCYLPRSPDPTEIPLELVPRLTKELRDLGCLIVTLSGGEPFVRPDLLDIITMFREAGLAVVLFTNGTLVTPSQLDHLAKLGLLRLEITIFSLTPETAAAMGCADPARAMANIEYARQLGLTVTVKTPVTRQNVGGLPEIAAWCQRLGADHHLDPLIQSAEDGHATTNFLLSPTETAMLLGEVTCACDVGPGTFSMRWDGTLIPCLTIPRAMGRWPRQTLREVLASSEARSIWKDIKDASLACRDCPQFRQCPRCPGLFFSEAGGKPWKYLCDVARATPQKVDR
jgi:radical SAM protein with 4Fe4S-binding SPASM domain